MHKLGCQYGASAYQLLPVDLGSHSKKKRAGGDRQSAAKLVKVLVMIVLVVKIQVAIVQVLKVWVVIVLVVKIRVAMVQVTMQVTVSGTYE